MNKMTIQQFIDALGGAERFDQIYVKDRHGNFVTVPGNTVFESVEMTSSKYPDLEFTV